MHEATLDAAECFGAMGVMRDMPMQKYVHDALVLLHSADQDSATKLQRAEALAGYERTAAA
jgi:alkylation response protein AidB-like acyl-CoA dehydrogenase